MAFWTGILVGGFFAWLAVRKGFYETWTLLFNVVISIYVSVLLTPVIADSVPAAGDTAYGNALTLTAIAAGTFLILHGISYTLFTGQFGVTFPKIFDNIGAGILGFLAGFLIWSFVALLISATPIGQKDTARTIGFGRKIEQSNGAYISWWCNLVNTIASSEDTRRPVQETVSRLLEKADKKTRDKIPEQPEPNKPPGFSLDSSPVFSGFVLCDKHSKI